ncbi:MULTISPECIES: single-stranded DNA-binding protein [unclassified Agromyces]|uniref:single-stranded DNA-binding protein n=1 Tax=unclassified Agromyces TaxID=2639701 RepID=UPI003015673C
MTDLVTVTGFVGNDPRHNVTGAGLAITNFRLASTRRYFDRAKGEWADGETNWYSVAAFRQLAVNAAASISKGDRVVVHGRLRVRPWETGEKTGTAVEIDAESIGHDLSWGRTTVTRTAAARAVDAEAPAEGDSAQPDLADAWARPGAGAAWPGADDATSLRTSPEAGAGAGADVGERVDGPVEATDAGSSLEELRVAG